MATKAQLAETIPMARLRREAKKRGVRTGGVSKLSIAEKLPKTVLQRLIKRG